MKLQHLAVIFVIIILPISLVLSSYIQTHISAIQLESQYTTRLMSATHDAALAFQLNTANNGYSTTQDSKMRDVEASISTFYNSLGLAMGSDGYTEADLQLYTPAILCTLYDGYYIYTKYNDIRYANTTEYDNGTVTTQDTANTNNLTSDNYTYGLKPFITYSCRYIKESSDSDFVVNYTLDNTITIIGKVNGTNVTKSGHLIYLPNTDPTHTIEGGIEEYIKFNINSDLSISEGFKENLVILKDDGSYEYSDGNNHAQEYEYVIYNSQKIYRYYKVDATGVSHAHYFWYGSDYRKNEVSSDSMKTTIADLFRSNTQGLKYYKEAVEFSKWVNDELGNILQSDSVDFDGNSIFSGNNYTELSNSDYIFKTKATDNDPLVSDSIFNEHRMNVIRYSITTNLNNVISTFGSINNNQFSMPKISEEEWYNIENNVTFVTFLQGLPMKSKTYNNYCVVSNNTNKETVNADSIYLVDSNETYHKPGCQKLIGELMDASTTTTIAGAYSAADFERKSILVSGSDVSAWTNAEDISAFFYPQSSEACYDCIVNAANINNVDNIIKYDSNLTYKDSSGNLATIKCQNVLDNNYRNIYLRALARERQNLYTINGYFGF